MHNTNPSTNSVDSKNGENRRRCEEEVGYTWLCLERILLCVRVESP
jgi:hypothetical protein